MAFNLRVEVISRVAAMSGALVGGFFVWTMGANCCFSNTASSAMTAATGSTIDAICLASTGSTEAICLASASSSTAKP